MIKVYLAGQWNEHANDWKKAFDLPNCDFYDPEIHSDQTSPDTYFPDDLNGVRTSDYMVANPGIAPSEGTWIEIGYFYATHTIDPGELCKKLIIIWPEDRQPKWSIDFVAKTGFVVKTLEQARGKLEELVAKCDIQNKSV